MILDIFSNIWNFLNDASNDIYNFIMKNYDQPFFWVILFGILLLIAVWAINNLANK